MPLNGNIEANYFNQISNIGIQISDNTINIFKVNSDSTVDFGVESNQCIC